MVENLGSRFEKQYNPDGYTVKEGDTAFSILNGMLKEDGIYSKYKNKINNLLNKYKELSHINPGDKFSLLEQDNNQIQITYNSGKGDKIYIINIANNTVFSIEDKQKEAIKSLKGGLDNFRQGILKELSENLNPELENIRSDIIKFLGSDKFTLEDNNKLVTYQKFLHSPEYKNNKIAIEYRKVIDVLTLPGDVSVNEAVDTISKVFEDKNITKSTKIRLAKCLRETFFGYLTVKVGNGYMADPGKGVEIVNELTKKFPNYDFDDFVMVSDPEGGEVIYTNIK